MEDEEDEELMQQQIEDNRRRMNEAADLMSSNQTQRGSLMRPVTEHIQSVSEDGGHEDVQSDKQNKQTTGSLTSSSLNINSLSLSLNTHVVSGLCWCLVSAGLCWSLVPGGIQIKSDCRALMELDLKVAWIPVLELGLDRELTCEHM